ncbi:MAG: DUF2326 domain-containing protein [Myxococcales bacterium]|nr:DUF2326 domain-containing protein [Myxococcales bacterium]MCB9583540.1 DUF2326 domain-containing protein [Polyangiaceae bacterium]
MVTDAILTFQEISSALYEDSKAGAFAITPTQNGPEFEIMIHGSKSKGVTNMQIFCFDMMLLSLTHGRSPGFVIHDSHISDGVDERQIGKPWRSVRSWPPNTHAIRADVDAVLTSTSARSPFG